MPSHSEKLDALVAAGEKADSVDHTETLALAQRLIDAAGKTLDTMGPGFPPALNDLAALLAEFHGTGEANGS